MTSAEAHPRLLNLRYGLVQATYWCENCTVCALAALYLMQFGLSPAVAGALIAGANLITCVLQPFVGAFADRTSRFTLKQIIYAFAGWGIAVSIGLELNSSVIGVCVLYALNTVLVVTVQPVANSLGLVWGERVNFGFARGTGSASLAITAAVVGAAAAQAGPTLIDDAMIAFWILFALSVLAFPQPHTTQRVREPRVREADGTCSKASHLSPLRDPRAREAEAPQQMRCAGAVGTHPRHRALRRHNIAEAFAFVRAYPHFCLVMVAWFFLMTSLLGSSLFLNRIVEAQGGDSSSMGIAIAIAALLELPAMSLYVKLRQRFGRRAIVMFAACGFVVKLGALWAAPSLSLIYAAQVLQVFSYALFVPASVDFVHTTMSPSDAVTGQTVLTSAQSLSMVVASFVGGALLEVAGLDATMLFFTASAAAGAVGTVALFVRPQNQAGGSAEDDGRKKRGVTCTRSSS